MPPAGKLPHDPPHVSLLTLGISIGRPGRMKALIDFVDYISNKEGVWVATRTEIAEAFKAKHPYKKTQ